MQFRSPDKRSASGEAIPRMRCAYPGYQMRPRSVYTVKRATAWRSCCASAVISQAASEASRAL